MSAGFLTILPPPQTLDSLDAWGGLDGLPFSLDDARWLSAGLYGLTVNGQGAAREAMLAQSRLRVLALTAGAVSGGSMEGGKVADLVELAGEGLATGRGALRLAVVRLLRGEGADGGGGGDATGGPSAGGAARLSRIVTLGAAGAARSRGDFRPGYKGWAWRGEKVAFSPLWRELGAGEATEGGGLPTFFPLSSASYPSYSSSSSVPGENVQSGGRIEAGDTSLNGEAWRARSASSALWAHSYSEGTTWH